MRQALKTNWQIDLPEIESEIPALETATPAPLPAAPAASATVLPFGTQRRPAAVEHRSEVVEVLAALSRAAEEIRNADTRTAQAEAVTRDLAERLAAAEQLARAAEEKAARFEEQYRIADGNIRLTERKFQQISDWQAQQVAETEAQLEGLRFAVETAQTRVIELEASTAEQDAAMRAIIEDAGNRLFASETRANDAVRDFEALRDFITTNFAR